MALYYSQYSTIEHLLEDVLNRDVARVEAPDELLTLGPESETINCDHSESRENCTWPAVLC